MTRNIVQVTPFMLVPDLEAALAFMTETLGFGVDFRMSDYAYVSREGAGLRMMAAGPGNPFQPGTRRFAYYFDCRDVDALYAELKPRLDRLPAGDVHGPADKPYRQRELLVLAPDGNLIAFGQAIAAAGG
ncbi:VOC family protein [Sphingosinicella sp. LHD-64]|uniref:bleomycin resistance protein n=1 Tax=Sphingosinicella sp. LHD-64 TaxID=3072139 RepID=UPI00280ECEF7|nr:VOC family protein [Sphingosinicella sp. LHD-64]MDQ8756089.1 VOC family protein [Sphingosinicella sp. LHD-64]